MISPVFLRTNELTILFIRIITPYHEIIVDMDGVHLRAPMQCNAMQCMPLFAIPASGAPSNLSAIHSEILLLSAYLVSSWPVTVILLKFQLTRIFFRSIKTLQSAAKDWKVRDLGLCLTCLLLPTLPHLRGSLQSKCSPNR